MTSQTQNTTPIKSNPIGVQGLAYEEKVALTSYSYIVARLHSHTCFTLPNRWQVAGRVRQADYVSALIAVWVGSAYQHIQSLPFGAPKAFGVIDQRTSSWTAPYRFTGKPACRRGRERDMETGLDYFGARYYSSGLSIWLSVDQLADKLPNISPYSYCYNHPVNYKDPDGEFPWITGLIAGVINVGINYTVAKIYDEEYNFTDGAIDFTTGFMAGSGGAVITSVSKLVVSTTSKLVSLAALNFYTGYANSALKNASVGKFDPYADIMSGIFGMYTTVGGKATSKVSNEFLEKIGNKKFAELTKKEVDKYLDIQEKYWTKHLESQGYKNGGKAFKKQLNELLKQSKELKINEIDFWKGTVYKTGENVVEITVDYIGTVTEEGTLNKIK